MCWGVVHINSFVFMTCVLPMLSVPCHTQHYLRTCYRMIRDLNDLNAGMDFWQTKYKKVSLWYGSLCIVIAHSDDSNLNRFSSSSSSSWYVHFVSLVFPCCYIINCVEKWSSSWHCVCVSWKDKGRERRGKKNCRTMRLSSRVMSDNLKVNEWTYKMLIHMLQCSIATWPHRCMLFNISKFLPFLANF